MKKRKKYTSGFKTKVVLEALQERKTIQEPWRKYGLHPNQISTRKGQFAPDYLGQFKPEWVSQFHWNLHIMFIFQPSQWIGNNIIFNSGKRFYISYNVFVIT